MFKEKIDNFLIGIEKKISLPVVSVLTGVFLLGCAMLYTSPVFDERYHNIGYSELSSAPFNFEANRDFQYRILAPLIGYIFFLRGNLFFIVPLIFGVLFLAVVYSTYRKKFFSPFESLLMASFLAFSCTVLIPLIAPGYIDTVSYFFLFLSITSAYNKAQTLSAFYFLFSVFTHESNFFMLPSLLLIHYFYADRNGVMKIRAVLKTLFIFILFLTPYLLFRYWVGHNANVRFTIDFYFSEDNLRTCFRALVWAPVGIFFAFKLLWFFPLYAVWRNLKTGNNRQMLIISSILIFTLAQLFIAYDITRMICLAFPAVLLSAEDIRSFWGKEKFISFVQKVMLFNLLILPYFAAKEGLFPMFSFIVQALIDRLPWFLS